MQPQNVHIRVGAGLKIQQADYESAAILAYLNRRIMFIGVRPDGTGTISDDQDELLAHGCQQIVWVSRLAADHLITNETITAEIERLHGGGGGL